MTIGSWPELRLAEWEPTYLTLHRWTQAVGKVRLALSPWANHWWHVPLYVCSRGLTTSMIGTAGGALTLTFDLCEHALVGHAQRGNGSSTRSFALEPMTVAEFYTRLRALLADLGISVRIWPVPVEVVDRTPFPEDEQHRSYDRAQVERLHRILINVAHVFAIHRGRFTGKCSPVHFFWGAFDLAVTRFSGRPNPTPPDDPVNRAAYSHEVISHGFWPGGAWPIGGHVPEAVFYAYAVPEPDGFARARVSPAPAAYSETLKEFLLPYDAVRSAPDPAAALLDFMESTYLAAAERAGWNVDALRDASHAQVS